MSISTTPSVQQLKRALELAEEIMRLEGELASLLTNRGISGGSTSAVGVPETVSAARRESKPAKSGGRRQLSPEARERIAAAQHRRWASARGSASAEKPAASASDVTGRASVSATRRRTLSPEGRARIAEAARRRWAAQRKGR